MCICFFFFNTKSEMQKYRIMLQYLNLLINLIFKKNNLTLEKNHKTDN